MVITALSRGSWPAFEDRLLSGCSTAFERRRKAIRYGAKSFAVERVVEDGDERLDIDVSTMVDRPADVRLCSWPSGALWFQAAQRGVRKLGGWDFLFSFEGTLGDLAPDELVSTFEASVVVLHGYVHESSAARLLTLWSRVQ